MRRSSIALVLGLVTFTALAQADEPGAAKVVGQRGEPVLRPHLVARANAARSTLYTLRAQLELYKIQHHDECPTLDRLENWAALCERTDVNGKPGGAATIGPYLTSPPVNPVNGKTGVAHAHLATEADGWSWNAGKEELRMVVPQHEVPRMRGWSLKDMEVVETQTKVSDPLAACVIALAMTLQTVNGQLELYAIQHQNRLPPAAGMAGWKLLLAKTGEDGRVAADGTRGPYLVGAPVNPFTGKSELVVQGAPAAGAGWVYHEKTGTVRAVLPPELRDAVADVLGMDSIHVAP